MSRRSPSSPVRTIADLPTPALLLDLDVLEANLARMQRLCDRLGVALRPHAKTHKCVEVARRQRAAGARGLTVSTLHEARVFADAGFDDLTWAFPLVLSRIGEATELAERATLRLVVDSTEAAAALAALGRPLHVFLKVDSGYGRAGVDPASPAALELARRIAGDPWLVFDGLLSHSGHAYHASGPAQARAAQEEERRRITELAGRLRGEGIEVPSVSVGSTPGIASLADAGPDALAGVTEARPGNYAVYDGTQAALGACRLEDCAVTVLTSVVSCQPGAGHAVVDAGALSLSKDAGPRHLGEGWRWGMGAVFPDLAAYRDGRPEEGLILTALSQEHGVLSRPLSRPLPVGARVRVLPNHSCLAVPNFPAFHVVRGDEVVDLWPIAGGRG